jgi:hypothetical protein
MRCNVIALKNHNKLLFKLIRITQHLIIPPMKSFVLWLITCRITYLLKKLGFGEGVFFISNSNLGHPVKGRRKVSSLGAKNVKFKLAPLHAVLITNIRSPLTCDVRRDM